MFLRLTRWSNVRASMGGALITIFLVLAAGPIFAGDLFDPAANYGAGTNPRSVCTADLDGDGDKDLAVANDGSDNVSILLNNGDGTYGTASDYAVGDGPFSVAAGDLDGDGDYDLAVANGNSNNVTILKNNGSGVFTAAGPYAVGSAPRSIVVAKLDGDAYLDLAVANNAAGGVSVLKNNGDGTFGSASSYTAGSGPYGVFAADLDGDGDEDLAVANASSNNVSVLKNDGAGVFGAASNYTAGTGTRYAVAADVDGDGDLDLAAANAGSDDVSVFINDGTGAYGSATNYAVGDAPYTVCAGDLDLDGDQDLAAANSSTNNVSVLLNDGEGAFGAADNYATGSAPRGVIAADLDNDYDLELATADYGGGVSVLKNNTDRRCPVDKNWATRDANFQRTGQAGVGVGDSWCDLTLNWKYEHPSQLVSYAGPIIYKDKVICSFTSEYKVFNLNDGALIYTLSGMGSTRCTPTVAEVNGVDMLFVSGTSVPVATVYAYNLNTGGLIWNRTDFTWGSHRWGTFIIWNAGGTDLLIYGTEIGKIAAVNAATGALWGGWAGGNPISLNEPIYISGTAGGSYIYFATMPAGAEGDLYAIAPATGTIAWQLSTGGGLQAGNVYTHPNGYFDDEGFSAGIAYEDGILYTNSRVAQGDYPSDGLFYRINGTNGQLVGPVTVSNRGYYSTPMINDDHAVMPTLSRWEGDPPGGGDLVAFDKLDGGIGWSSSNRASGSGRYYVSGCQTCEESISLDQTFAFNEDGYLSCFNSESGEELWHRRVYHGPSPELNIGMSGAIVQDSQGRTHVVFADHYGSLYDFIKGADRPRLELETVVCTVLVDHGSAPSLQTATGKLFVNTGCADLVMTLTPSDVSNGTSASPSAAANFNYGEESFKGDLESGAVDRRQFAETLHAATSAAGFPPFLNSPGYAFPVGAAPLVAGDTTHIILDINQAALNPDSSIFYLQVSDHNDPDYFLNDNTIDPEIKVVIIIDTDRDGVPDVSDNCSTVANPDQIDADGDDIGDVCDACTDTDGDGFGNPGYAANTCPLDNCTSVANPDQLDTDGNGVGNACGPPAVMLDHVDGLLAPGQIQPGVPITFYFRFINTTGYAILGCSNGIELKSTDGATWQPLAGSWMPGIHENYMDLGTSVTYRSNDGASADTAGFLAATMLRPGFPNGYDDIVFTITTTFDASGAGKTISIDSCWFPPSNGWKWFPAVGTVDPSWPGPYSFEIVSPYVCGDANSDGQANVGDAVYLINFVFKGGPAPNPLCKGDANDDNGTNVGDAVYMINYVFKGGPAPKVTCCP